MFKEGTDVRLRHEEADGPFVSLSRPANLSRINERINESQVTSIRRGLPDISEEDIQLARENAARAGVHLADWNLYYVIEAPDPGAAEILVEELKSDSNVEHIYPLSVTRLFDGGTTPDLSGEQNYLKPNETHGGLNVISGWEAGATGGGVTVVDEEGNWNFNHEDLPIDEEDLLITAEEYPISPKELNSYTVVQHGTAIVGVVAGKDNGSGIKGITPDATIKLFRMVKDHAWDPLAALVVGLVDYWLASDGSKSEIKPGDIIILTSGSDGPSGGKCNASLYPQSETGFGCLPEESKPITFQAIINTIESGFIIIEAAGNGEVELNADVQLQGGPDLSKVSSGAIMVGASLGANKKKAPWSNCGDRVDVYAWGSGVVTTGFGHYGVKDKIRVWLEDTQGKTVGQEVCFLAEGTPGYADTQITDMEAFNKYITDNYPELIPPKGIARKYRIAGFCSNPDGTITYDYDDDPSTPELDMNDSNKWYTSHFSGTSSAAAIIGGVAAQIQGYVKKIYVPNARLTPKQMKDILIASGVPAVGDENCNIGVQPDVGKAIELLNSGAFAPEFEVLPLDPASEDVVSGIRYDMDGDGRAELISLSRDGKWYIDLSSVPCSPDLQVGQTCGDDGYGAWDLILEAGSTMQEAGMLFPVVHDYNSDGKADLALYDSINGKWYIKYTTNAVLTPSPPVGEGGGEGVIEWDRVIDYTTDPSWKAYSRPVPGDYDGDRWLDPALQTPDGHWLIDYGGFDGAFLGINQGVKYSDKFGTFDKDVAYLTDEQLAQAPGWAYIPIDFIDPSGNGYWIEIKGPDGISSENKDIGFDMSDDENVVWGAWGGDLDNDVFMIGASYYYVSHDIGLKTPDGKWNIIDYNITGDIITPQPNGIFGDINCRPTPADYDGDGLDDRAVQCGTTWKIAYSSDAAQGFREVELNDALDPVPAYVYPGGIKYQDTVDLYNYYKGELGGTKDSTIFDAPPPIGPYFAQCVKTWALDAAYCWDK